MHNTIGLDVYGMTAAEHRQCADDGRGLGALHRWIEQSGASLVVFEASGICHRRLESSLSAGNVPYSKATPRQARRFAEATGKIAKTDKVDAEILAKTGSILELEPQAPKAEYLNILRERMTARRGLIKDRATVRARMRTTAQKLLKRHLKERLAPGGEAT